MQFYDPNHRFSFCIPDGWQVTQTHEAGPGHGNYGLRLHDSALRADIIVEVMLRFGKTSLDHHAEMHARYLRERRGYQLDEPATAQWLGNAPAKQWGMTYREADNQPIVGYFLVALPSRGPVLHIRASALPSEAGALEAALAVFIPSWEFVSPPPPDVA